MQNAARSTQLAVNAVLEVVLKKTFPYECGK